jgi:hypothetical protein
MGRRGVKDEESRDQFEAPSQRSEKRNQSLRIYEASPTMSQQSEPNEISSQTSDEQRSMGSPKMLEEGGAEMPDECHGPVFGKHSRTLRPLDEALETHSLAGGSACSHSRGVALQASLQDPDCGCEDAMTRDRKRRFFDSESLIREWTLVRVCYGPEFNSSSDSGIVLSSNYLRFAPSSNSEAEVVSTSSRGIVAIGLLMSGRIIQVRTDSLLEPSAVSPQFHVAAFTDAIARACSDCHHRDSADASEETMARIFVSKMQICGFSARPTFERVFDCIGAVCLNHELEETCRVPFVQALRCACSFKSFQARFVTDKGVLVLVSLLHSCRSCLSADLALNCIAAIMANAAAAAHLVCPQIIEALLSLIDRHVSTASKANTIIEQW